MSVSIDSVAFKRRLHLLQRSIKDDKDFDSISALITTLGKGDTDTQGKHTSALHIWLLGYPFANTAISVTPERCVIITSAKQGKHLEDLKSPGVEIRVRSKDAEESRQVFAEMAKDLVPANGTIGEFASDDPQSAIADVWREELDKVAPSDKRVDVSAAFDILLENKDEDELRAIRTASKAVMGVMTMYFADEMSTLVDEDAKITHADFANKVSAVIDNTKLFRKFKLGSEFDTANLDWSYAPLIESGGHFDLSHNAVSDKNRLTAGVIYCSLGLRYKFYCSSIARTYLIDPTKEQEHNYNLLLAVQKKALSAIKDGVQCSEVYAAAKEYLAEKEPSLVDKLSASVGYGIGIEPRNLELSLTADNHHKLKDGMCVTVEVSFKDLEGADGQPYILGLTDTLRVTEDAPIVFTDSPKSREEISLYFKQDEDEEAKAKAERATRTRGANAAKSGNGHNVRKSQREHDDSGARILQHQQELKQRLQERGTSQYSEAKAVDEEDSLPVFKRFESYKRETQLPQAVKDLRVMVDTRAQTIILPISGRPVPFHINTYKNGSKNEEGDYVYLRLNFNSPDTGAGRKDEIPFEDPQATFVKSVTIRSRDTERMNETFRKIQELKRETVRRDQERKVMEDVVQQEKLIEVRDRRPPRLEPVFVRPMPEGKRVAGSLEIHKNGLRYQSPLGKEQQIEVLFSNVSNLFFQPSNNELIVLVHMHLKNPIMIGKRKTKDIQFYRDATDMSFDDTGNKKRRYRYGDEDELEMEQEERRLRATLNKEFNAFADQISKASNGKLSVDIPFRELGFNGVPFRSNVLLQPTTDCLVHLIDTPFLVVPLDEVELVNLERVQFGLKNFDMVFIYKDYSKPVTHINTVSVDQLDSVKDWLNEMDIPFYEGPLNLAWPQVMKTITSDTHDFFATGGWSFLANPDDEEPNPDEEEVEEGSEFEASDVSAQESEDYSDEASDASEGSVEDEDDFDDDDDDDLDDEEEEDEDDD